MEVIHEGPSSNSFIPLAEHQSRTPQSFHSGPPILYHFSTSSKVVLLEGDLRASPALATLRGDSSNTATNGHSNEDEEGSEEKEVVIDNVDVWVTSQKLILFSTTASSGVSIPYPSISLHAIQRLPPPGATTESESLQGLYMQLVGPEKAETDEDLEEESISLSIIPQSTEPFAATAGAGASEAAVTTEGTDAQSVVSPEETQTPTEALFAALSACSNLHPGAASGDEDEGGEDAQQIDESILFQNGLIAPGNSAGGLPPAMPGSGGWITAENVHEYFDEEGNWKGGDEDGGEGEGEEERESLGPGAGTVRPREEDKGDGGEEDETKWRRTD